MTSAREPTVKITRKGVKRLKGGHLWIYKSDVAETHDVSPGCVARVEDERGWFLGRAFYSQQSSITLRLLTTEDRPIDRAFFGERLDAAIALRQRLFGEEPTLRLVHSEADLLPGLVVDRYDDVLSIQTHSQGTDRLKETFYDLLEERLSPRSIVERNESKVRSYEGLSLVREVARGEAPGVKAYSEGALTFFADPLEGQKTGAFLDQRENHVRVEAYVEPGMRCLDVFTYNGGFGLHMAKAGGEVTAIDVSADALRETARAAEANKLQLELVEDNAFDWLKANCVDGEPYDLIVLDPPSFARSKGALEGAKRGYKEINLRALQLLKPGGILVSASCSYHMNEQLLLETVLSAAQDAGRRVQLIERRGASRDHPTLLGVPETSYLKCLFFRRVD